jgi:hypothetical protein
LTSNGLTGGTPQYHPGNIFGEIVSIKSYLIEVVKAVFEKIAIVIFSGMFEGPLF